MLPMFFQQKNSIKSFDAKNNYAVGGRKSINKTVKYPLLL